MPINKNELTKEQIAKAMSCETVEDDERANRKGDVLRDSRGTHGVSQSRGRGADERGSRGVFSGDRRLGTGQRRAEKCGGRLQALLYKTLLYKKYKTERVIFNRCVST